MHTIPAKELATFISSRLEGTYDTREATNISRELLYHFYQLDRLQLSMNESVSLPKNEEKRLLHIIERLTNHEPLQHVIGSVEFYGLEFKTDARALIPRPETEELVDWIVRNHREPDLKVMDIGTGTGCIPVSLAKHMNTATIAAVDVSAEALTLARENAKLNGLSIDFRRLNILEEDLPDHYDIIVSNPPYIPASDQAIMSPNVLAFEPGLALFVSDDSPLIFYIRIATLASESLKRGGKLYFEIHENYGAQIVNMLENYGYEEIELRQDMQGKDRMIKAMKP